MADKKTTTIKAKGKMVISTDDGKRVEIENPEVLLVKKSEGAK